ncbi:ParB/RepB/Spo0J family partition protein [Mycolicibacterium goodii]|uniref:ParB/RepB/Spo0J family partition protein n=1 Tax=Mycolicibacterium goodii TaxID=134601 RepID=UPI001BDD7168|nr:ParB/RepB/Spo0J family partition protein [Mycolicibacterium goodii]MBU8820731.1 ParB/RepB/Spo0J family partition protein [Mycolicibacterium goodii]
MTTPSTSTVAKRTARKGPGRKTVSKLTRYAGGAESAELLAAAKEVTSLGGITEGLASIAAADGLRFVEAPTAAIAPHPYNAAVRSAPQPDSASWVELVNSVKAAGVQVPILLVTRAAFAAARPELDKAIAAEAEYITIYGHRRRAAAAAAGLRTVPAVIDDGVLVDGGDLDAMTIENLGREDLTAIQQAEMFARYSEAGVGQRAIGEKLGVNQSTVSRRLRLLLLAPEVLDRFERGKIKIVEAAQLAKRLPYGPPRAWQQEDGGPDPDQESDERRADQIAACELVAAGATPQRAVERVLAERRARSRAHAEGVELVDARKRFGPNYQHYVISSPSDADGDVVAAIDPLQGELIYFPASLTGQQSPIREAKNDSKLRTVAMKARRAAGPRLVASPPPREKLLPLLARQYAAGIAGFAMSSAGWNLAYEYSRSAGLSAAMHSDVASFRSAAVEETDTKRQIEVAWACAVAAYELYASDKARDRWNSIDATYLELLQDRANYTPTSWEMERIALAKSSHNSLAS